MMPSPGPVGHGDRHGAGAGGLVTVMMTSRVGLPGGPARTRRRLASASTVTARRRRWRHRGSGAGTRDRRSWWPVGVAAAPGTVPVNVQSLTRRAVWELTCLRPSDWRPRPGPAARPHRVTQAGSRGPGGRPRPDRDHGGIRRSHCIRWPPSLALSGPGPAFGGSDRRPGHVTPGSARRRRELEVGKYNSSVEAIPAGRARRQSPLRPASARHHLMIWAAASEPRSWDIEKNRLAVYGRATPVSPSPLRHDGAAARPGPPGRENEGNGLLVCSLCSQHSGRTGDSIHVCDPRIQVRVALRTVLGHPSGFDSDLPRRASLRAPAGPTVFRRHPSRPSP